MFFFRLVLPLSTFSIWSNCKIQSCSGLHKDSSSFSMADIFLVGTQKSHWCKPLALFRRSGTADRNDIHTDVENEYVHYTMRAVSSTGNEIIPHFFSHSASAVRPVGRSSQHNTCLEKCEKSNTTSTTRKVTLQFKAIVFIIALKSSLSKLWIRRLLKNLALSSAEKLDKKQSLIADMKQGTCKLSTYLSLKATKIAIVLIFETKE